MSLHLLLVTTEILVSTSFKFNNENWIIFTFQSSYLDETSSTFYRVNIAISIV